MSYDNIKAVSNSSKESLKELLFNIDKNTEGSIVVSRDQVRSLPFYYNLLLQEYIENGKLVVFRNDDIERDCYGVINNNESFSYVNNSHILVEKNEQKAEKISDKIDEIISNSKELKQSTPSITQLKNEDTALDESFFNRYVELLKQYENINMEKVLIATGAEFESLVYDVCKESENIGLCSKATVSRAKTEVIDNTNLVETENVPIDVGRPRLRLESQHSADEILKDIK